MYHNSNLFDMAVKPKHIYDCQGFQAERLHCLICAFAVERDHSLHRIDLIVVSFLLTGLNGDR